MSSRRPSSRTTSQSQSQSQSQSNGKTRIKAKRRYLLKVTPIEAWGLLPAESGRARNAYCTMVLLDENKREIKGEKQRTPPLRQTNPVWSPLKAAVLRSLESNVESHQPLGIGAAAASEEYTFGIQTNLMNAKYVLVKCKDKGRVENEDLGRLLLSLEDMNTSGEERVAWYDLQLRPGGKMKRVQGKVRISSRIMREPSLWQLWTCAEQMRQELPAKDRSLYLKPHPNVITGKEAVEWMLCHGLNRPMQGGVTCSTPEEALLLGTALIRNGVMMHVSGDRRFTNSTWKYYRFMVNHLDSAVQKEAIRQRDMILSGEAEEVEDTEVEVLTRTMMASSVSNEEENGLGTTQARGGVAGGSGANEPAGDSNRGKSKSTLKIEDFELLKVLGTGTLDIIYRDLKPENILIQKDGHVVLVDFGLSTYARDETDKKAYSLAGSPEYISPEVLAAANPKKGEPPAIYDKTCDWWSLGILIFEMFVGRTPFKDDNKAIMYRNIAEGFLYIPPELPEDVQSLLAGLIERDPSKRLGANEAVPFSIMKHPYFEGIDWEELQQKKVQPEWVPDVIDDADAKYVDNEFINQVPVDTPEWRMLDSVDREREYFDDFTYRATRVIQK
ncbi:hypothetical protein PF005_g8066 [Phytophthora fragariae]|uniref:Protein kinase domain-containing protein n=1 Tax=Phytophthora fragariae TaxID=53985 RepID=A0A6A3YK47_9STRA|nr:hypothetical protein PF005_g8066 [Phytophthora fragariae]